MRSWLLRIVANDARNAGRAAEVPRAWRIALRAADEKARWAETVSSLRTALSMLKKPEGVVQPAPASSGRARPAPISARRVRSGFIAFSWQRRS